VTDDLGLFRDAIDDTEQPGSTRRIGGRRQRRQALERRRRRIVLSVVLVVLALAAGGIFAGIRQLEAWRKTPDFTGAGGAAAVVQVENGQSLSAIGAALVRRKVVASVRAFTQAAEADPRSRAVQPGYYQLREQMSGSAAVARLQEPAARVGHLEIRGGEQLDDVRLPDGRTVPGLLTDISRASCAVNGATSTCVSSEELRTAMEQANLDQLDVPVWAAAPIARVEPNRRLEGLLVPGNYDVRPGSSAAELLRQVTSTSMARLLVAGFPAAAASTGYSAYDVLVIASIIEREAITADFGRVSRVIYNRLADGMVLQMDSTINYPLDLQQVRTSDADRARPGPYNTYLNSGLPVSPIGSPSAAAISAALNPEPGDWRYFVKCQQDGTSCFSVTITEHGAAVRDAAARGVF
jgi:UPF0755 protein